MRNVEQWLKVSCQVTREEFELGSPILSIDVQVLCTFFLLGRHLGQYSLLDVKLWFFRLKKPADSRESINWNI